MLKQQIEQDIKTAMLAGDKTMVMTLRGLKSAILYVEVAQGLRETGLGDTAVTDLLAKEAKKRQESADLYKQGGNLEKAEAELQEKQVIEKYLPKQLSDDDLVKLVDEAIASVGELSKQTMGQVIGHIKAASQGAADGSRIANLVRERMS